LAAKRIPRRWEAAAVQMTSTTDVDCNVRRAASLIRDAAEDGADLVALPENFAYLRTEGTKLEFKTTIEGDLVRSMRDLARELGVHLLLGSIPERVPRSPRTHNTSVLIGPRGDVLAVYRKMHLFDIDIRGRVSLRESRFVAPGKRPVLADTRLGRLGLSVCYDLRFPELYRWLALRGAQVLFVPAAFTAYTGPHHWLPLLRARAIENQCWVVAPAQVGRHSADRQSHGETVIIDPWGVVVARKARGQGSVAAEIDLERLDRVRRGLPCLEHTHPSLVGRRPRPSNSRR
jgi:predicted amidohydrolase